MEDVKIKFPVLWLFVGISFIAQVVLNILKPGTLAQVMEGSLEGMHACICSYLKSKHGIRKLFLSWEVYACIWEE